MSDFKVYSIIEAAKALSMRPETLRKFIREGTVTKYHKIGDRVKFTEDDLKSALTPVNKKQKVSV